MASKLVRPQESGDQAVKDMESNAGVEPASGVRKIQLLYQMQSCSAGPDSSMQHHSLRLARQMARSLPVDATVHQSLHLRLRTVLMVHN